MTASTANPLLNPGHSVTVSVPLTNNLAVPARVTVTAQPTTGVTFTPDPDVVTLPSDGAGVATFTATATAAGAGAQTIALAVTTVAAGASYPQTPSSVMVNVAYPTLAAAFDNAGIATPDSPGATSFDTNGDSFSETELTTAGEAPGATFSHDGIPYTWPSSAPDAVDNVIGNGQAIQLSGRGTTLGLLGASDNGDATGPVTVVYTDGTTSTSQVTLDDWYDNQAATGGDILVTTPNWLHASNEGDHAVSVYAASVPLDAGKTVADAILPSSADEASTASGPFHVFALGIGS